MICSLSIFCHDTIVKSWNILIVLANLVALAVLELKNLEILTTLAVFVIMAAWLRPFGRRPADLQIYFKFSIGSHLDIPGYMDILLVFSFQIPPGEDCPDAFLGELDRGTQLKNLIKSFLLSLLLKVTQSCVIF